MIDDDKPTTITVNSVLSEISGTTVGYRQIANMAGFFHTEPAITWNDPATRYGGMLSPGQTVEVPREGAVFNVYDLNSEGE